jgi:hypothetical protein
MGLGGCPNPMLPNRAPTPAPPREPPRAKTTWGRAIDPRTPPRHHPPLPPTTRAFSPGENPGCPPHPHNPPCGLAGVDPPPLVFCSKSRWGKKTKSPPLPGAPLEEPGDSPPAPTVETGTTPGGPPGTPVEAGETPTRPPPSEKKTMQNPPPPYQHSPKMTPPPPKPPGFGRHPPTLPAEKGKNYGGVVPPPPTIVRRPNPTPAGGVWKILTKQKRCIKKTPW